MLRRNLDYPDDVPITELGAASLDDLLERGDLESWVPIAQAVQREPHGALADTILRLCQSHERLSEPMWRQQGEVTPQSRLPRCRDRP